MGKAYRAAALLYSNPSGLHDSYFTAHHRLYILISGDVDCCHQRAHLIRTNNKLGQMLGSTPHILDCSYRDTASPALPAAPLSHPSRSKSHSRDKSLPEIIDDDIRAISPVSVHSTSSTSSRESARSNVSSQKREQSWRVPYPAERPPLLTLSTPVRQRTAMKPTVETIPGSPSGIPSEETDDTHPYHPLESPTEPSFNIPSQASMRREKMQRLTKKLGENIPIDLVFPPTPAVESDSDEESPLLETPTTMRSCSSLPTIQEDSPERESLALEEPLRRSRSAHGARHRSSHGDGSRRHKRDVDTFDGMQCVGVSASAGTKGKGISGRWVKKRVPFEQIGGPWSTGFFGM
ncbi:hypothetical protein A0H81_01854 [Grifola frondosa]|uniref:Uncharacterized protein n=1 Tax=Grifola frondosa TaxID=5627 RepID=A0A1C7MKH8_GRIFR|nr:hypothetical protein A0H81_01854 [Grifola frondosa]